MMQGVAAIAIGLMFLFVGLGRARVSKNPEVNAAFVERWGKFFVIAGPIIALIGVLMVVGAL